MALADDRAEMLVNGFEILNDLHEKLNGRQPDINNIEPQAL